MSALTEDQARTYMHKLLAAMAAGGGSDLFIANDFPPSMKVDGGMKPMTAQKLTADVTRALAQAMMNEKQREEFARELECNFAVTIPGTGRFRINILVQQQCVSLVCRTIAAEIPNFEKLKLPEVLKEVVMAKRGLVLVVGRHRLGQVDLAGGHDRPPQPHLVGPHHHRGRSGGVRARVAEVARHAPRGGRGHAQLAPMP